ncbi:MAG: hypothetical protein KF886_08215 [Candidatus Hydrogenedentes bacterium]|nr:hypothetical protein [Candidatus Hydrogenedentota bacterium]
MSRELIPAPADPGAPRPTHPMEGPKPAENPLLLVHKLLRGRYLIAIVLACILGPGGAAIGYFALPLEYTSNSTIRIAPVLPKILYESDQNSMMPMFDSFLNTQVALITSRRVVEMAMQTTTWRSVGGEYSVEAFTDFMENLKVVQPRGSQLIQVSFTDGDPARARAATKAVVDSYTTIYGETDQARENQRLQLLEERARSLNNQIDGLDAQILEVAHEFGSDDLTAAHAFEVNNVQTLQSELEAAKLQLSAFGSGTQEPVESDALDHTKLTIDEIALRDRRMQSLLDEKKRIQREIDAFEATMRRPESRPEYRLAKESLKLQDAEIESYAQTYRENPILWGPGAAGADENFLPAMTADQLRARVDRLQSMYDEAQTRTLDIGRKNLRLRELRSNLARLQESLSLTNSRIEALSLESTAALGGRITVLSEAEPPSGPSNAKRRTQFTILGGLAGGGIGVALVLALGFLNSRLRDIEDAQDIRPRLLGALPLLPDAIGNPLEAFSAAQCVHQIRTILHAHMPPHEPLALTITASNSGAGKTSFALSLGLSFASAGARTLIIDGDVVGTGLTRRTGATARRKLGHVLRKYEVITEEESRHALEMARGSGRPIGHALLELGYISEQDLEEGLSMQKDAGLGLGDALAGEPVENCLADVGVPHLSILPASRRNGARTHAMSPIVVRRMLDELRASFDVILIDAGPVPGPTDATIMATCADGVIMVASRGDQGGDIQRALQYLQELHVPVVGLVFNRADALDIERSRYSSSTVSGGKREAHPHEHEHEEPIAANMNELLETVARYGPLPQSVWLSTMHPAVFSEAGAPV